MEEQLSFKDGRFPSQLVTGFSGTEEDINPLPAEIPTQEPAPGVAIDAFSSWVKGFGFAVLEREGGARWRIEIRDPAGAIVNTCSLDGRQSRCVEQQVTDAADSPDGVIH